MSILRPWLIAVLLLFCSAGSARGEIRLDFEMDHDPEIHIPAAVTVFSNRLKPLWLEALARPEADLQRMAAAAIGRAHVAGFPDMDGAVPGLIAVLTAPASHPAARLAAARTLVLLDAKGAARQMAESAEKYGADLRQIVEPALPGWNYEPYRAVWQARLTGAGVRHRDLILAIRCLGMVHDGSRVPALLELVHDRNRPPDLRLEAAQAAGTLQGSGLEADARRLMAGGSAIPLVNRLCAAKLMARHDGADGQNLLAELGIDREPAVAVMALTRLIEIDPHLALPLAESSMQSADAKVRQRGADACVLAPDPQRVAQLVRLLDDPHPTVRSSVRDSLFELAQRPELSEPVWQAATGMLAGDRWRGLEQAALLLAALDYKPAAGRLVELLEFSRPEVAIAAAWGLKKLAVPETLPAMLDKASRQTEIRRKISPDLAGLDEQTAHLFEAFGQTKHTPAEPLLRVYIPKDFKMGALSRSSAIWSLGLLHAGVADEKLASQLAERAFDPAPIPAELEPVRTASLIAIGRMKAVSQLETLKKQTVVSIAPTRLGMSLRWALIELATTGRVVRLCDAVVQTGVPVGH
jgi:HEAT repeat protein